jgi:hypothetical protein
VALALLAQFLMHSGHDHHNDTIPPGLGVGGLHFLAACDLSNNNLTGEIPTWE